MSSSSDLTISSDWDVIDNETSQPDSSTNIPEETTNEDSMDKTEKGSCVDDIITVQEIIGELEGVPNVTDLETNNQHESSSSSEFDVLDEAVEDNQSNMSFSHMEYSLSSSLESSQPALVIEGAEVEADPDDETPQPISSQGHSLNMHPYLLAITLSLAFIAIVFATAPFNSFQQLKKRVSALQTENSELKNLVQSKMENDKILLALEEQIKSLKDENFQLSLSMKSLITQLEEQTLILKKDKERKVQDPYRGEIEKLKEQINILQIDNEDLQKQLVRTRYGIYSPHPKDSNTNPSAEEKEEIKDKTDNKENRDNSSEILMEEINELRKKLYAEVEKLKSWKDSVQDLVKELGNEYTGSSSKKEEESFKSKKTSEKTEKPKETKAGRKGKKFSDWSWGSVQKNIRDTYEGLQDIDVSNVISNYLDRKKIEGVFESVNHYFKKAQEKTKKVLNFNNDVNDEMWHFFGHLKNQWNDVKSKYFQKNYPPKQTPPKTEDYKSHYHEHKPQPPHSQDFETDKKFNRYEKESKPNKASNKNNNQHLYPDLESFITTETPDSEKNSMAPEDEETNVDNSWMFKRAAHRSQLREEEQEAFTNWFLKRGKDFHYNEDESLKEWFKETYQNGNDDEE